MSYHLNVSKNKKSRKPKSKNRRDTNPANQNNWKLVCTVCGAEFANTETIDLSQGHKQEDHPDLETPEFSLIWVGIGPAPKPKG